MEQNQGSVQKTAWEDLAVEFRERAGKHERSARLDMLLIVATLVSCVLIFAGSDRLADWVFQTPSERRADSELANAKAEVYRAIASLGTPSGDFIRSLPAIVRPYLDRMLAEKTGKAEEAAKGNPDLQSPPSSAARPAQDRPSSASPPVFQAPAAPVREPKSTLPALARDENVRLHERLKSLYEDNSALHLQLQQERERMDQASNQSAIEQAKSDAAIEVARIKADAEVNTASEATQRSSDLNNLVSSALTRVGAVVMVIWLVKIFVRKRQQSVQLSTFYLAASDAALLSNGDMNSFSKLFSKITPVIDADPVDSPAEAMSQALVALAKRNTTN
jgi:hypothetical protein